MKDDDNESNLEPFHCVVIDEDECDEYSVIRPNNDKANDIKMTLNILSDGFNTGSYNSNDMSHITLDLNSANGVNELNLAESQDFNEALFLCSGTFGMLKIDYFNFKSIVPFNF